MNKAIGVPVYLDAQRALEMIGDEPSVRDILQMAEQGLRQGILQIGQLLQAGEVAEVRQVLHTIKGSLPIFCADSLVEQVLAVEKLCQTAGAPEVISAFAGVEGKLVRLADEIQVYLEAPAS